MSFCLEKETPFIIYGAGKTGSDFYRNLIDAGYRVDYIFDQRLKNVDWAAVPVIKLTEQKKHIKNPNNYIVVITLKSSLVQEKIAQELYQLGYQKIVYLPASLTVRFSRNQLILKMIKIYHDFEKGLFEDIFDIPDMGNFDDKEYQDQAMIKKERDFIVAWVPLALIYTNDEIHKVKFMKEHNLKIDHSDFLYQDINIAGFTPYIELFKFLENGKGNIDLYMNFIKGEHNLLKVLSSKDNQVFLHDRAELFNLFSTALNHEMEFFIESAPEAIWNQKGYFNLQDGHHRAAFFQIKGMDKMPLRISGEDYARWKNIISLNPVMESLSAYGTKNIDMPILHPFFYHMLTDSDQYGQTLLSALQGYISYRNIEKCTFAGFGFTGAYFLQNLSRMGSKRGYLYEEDISVIKLLEKINDLYGLNNIQMLNRHIAEETKADLYDYTCAFDVFDKVGAEKDRNIFLKKIEQVTKHLIIWRSGCNAEKEKAFIRENSCFKHFKFLKHEFHHKQISQVGLFSRDGNFIIGE